MIYDITYRDEQGAAVKTVVFVADTLSQAINVCATARVVPENARSVVIAPREQRDD
jgi:hypothetical protein